MAVLRPPPMHRLSPAYATPRGQRVSWIFEIIANEDA
jgi:hypothetical protein